MKINKIFRMELAQKTKDLDNSASFGFFVKKRLLRKLLLDISKTKIHYYTVKNETL